MEKQELFTQISELYTQFETEHAGTSKASAQRARNALSSLKKLISAYNKASVAEVKAK
jgi:hypothetical protein